MDTYRGNFVDNADGVDDWPEFESHDDEVVRETPPSPVGQDERRMQVRAYNHWASLLGDRSFPSIEDLDPDSLPDFGPYSVLLDFTGGIENPSIQFLGEKLAAECGAEDEIETLSDVPSRSLLSRITDHYMQILANQAPIGFEAEFVNQREATILYRGILLPFSSDDDTIDFIYGVINWKELADQQTTDELLLEIDQALEVPGPELRHDEMTDWADGPADLNDAVPAETGFAEAAVEAPIMDDEGYDLSGFELEPETAVADVANDAVDNDADDDANVLDLGSFAAAFDEDDAGDSAFPEPAFGGFAALPQSSSPREVEPAPAPQVSAPADDWAPVPLPATSGGGDMALADWLASARELAEAARGSEDRTRHALYAAIGRAYDFSLAATEAADDFNELVSDAGLTVQDRAPMTPVVKLVFGADYDKTRLTEYATALSHAHRLRLAPGSLADYLSSAPGGLKGVVTEERRAKRAEAGVVDEVRDTPREALAKKLRNLQQFPFEAVPAEGSEFTLLVARRLPTGEVVLLGEIGDDVPLLERAARRLLS